MQDVVGTSKHREVKDWGREENNGLYIKFPK